MIPAFDENKEYDEFLKDNYQNIFEKELNGWYTDSTLWPNDRSWKIFQEWFDYEIHTMVYGIGKDDIKFEE